MKTSARHTPPRSTTLLGLAVVMLFLFLGAPAFAQNTKGDSPSTPKRENRFKVGTKKKQKDKNRTKRIRSKSKSVANSGTQYTPRRRPKGERAGKPITPTYRTSKPDNKQRPWKGDITGRRIRHKGTSESGRYIHPQRGRYVRRSVPEREGRQNVTRERVQTPSGSGRIRNTFPQRGRYTHNPSSRPRDTQQAVSNRRQLARARQLQRSAPRTATARQTKVKPRSASKPYIRNKSINAFANFKRPQRKGERAVTKDIAGRPLRTKNYETPRPQIMAPATPPVRRKRVGDRPYAGPIKGKQRTIEPGFRRNKSINPYANFRRPKKKGERAVTTDLAGRRLRTKNYETPRPGLIAPPVHPGRRKRDGDRPYAGASMGRFGTSARPRERAWTGDIANRRIRHRDRSDVYRSASRSGGNKPLPAGRRGGFLNLQRRGNMRTLQDQGEEFTGNIKVRRGGMADGAGRMNRSRQRTFANQGEEFTGNIKMRRGGLADRAKLANRSRQRTFADQGEEFTGNIKVRRGGLADQGKLANRARQKTFADQGEEFTGNIKMRRGGLADQPKVPNRSRPKTFADQGEEFTGNIKVRRGGLSDRTKVANRSRPKTFADQGEEFTGFIKSGRPDKGGGSVSGKRWNNQGNPIPGRVPANIAGQGGLGKNRLKQRTFADQGEEFTGFIKLRRPEKGGGSENGLGKTRFRQKIFSDQGEEYTGHLKVDRAKGAVAHKPKDFPRSERRTTAKPDFLDQGEEFTGYVRLPRFKRNYVRNKNAHEEAMLKKRPDKTVYEVDGLQVSVKQKRYVKNKNAAAESLLKVKPEKTVQEINGLQVKVRSYHYKHNPSSADDALKTREPGKAFARATQYQGNIKMQKFSLFEKNRALHPDAQFVKLNKNNVAGEKNAVTNFKLWWARLFRKQETQPDHLKEKTRKPRYDDGEQGLWYD